MSGAARSLKVDHATVSRRLAALEAELQAPLVERLPRSCRLTPLGLRLHEQAQAMEASAFALERLARASQEPMAGKVTLSAPPVLVTHLLARRLADFRRAHPAIQLSVSAQAQQVSLNRREADVALRLVRPRESSYLVRKLGQMPFALYASSDYALRQPDNWTFIAYDAQFSDMPQQRWLLDIAGQRAISCELSDISSHLAAARAGAGVAGLPCFLGDHCPELLRLEHGGPAFSRDIWLVVHRDLPFRARAGRHGLCRRYRRGAIRLQPWTLLARHWQRAAMNRPGRAQGESAAPGRLAPRRYNRGQSRLCQPTSPTHPMSQSVPIGYSDVPRGHIASVVTDLEMLSAGHGRAALPEGITLTPASRVSLDAYRALFREVGADWLWFSRLFMADEELAATLGHPDVDIQVVQRDGKDVGILELDFRVADQCELTFMGLTAECTGRAWAGR